LTNTDLLKDIVDAYILRDRNMLLRKLKKAVEKFNAKESVRSKEKITCQHCKQKEFLFAKNMCRPCYDKVHVRPKKVCVQCGKEDTYSAKGMCASCYSKYSYQRKIMAKKGATE